MYFMFFSIVFVKVLSMYNLERVMKKYLAFCKSYLIEPQECIKILRILL